MKNKGNKELIERAILLSSHFYIEEGNTNESGLFRGYRIVFGDGVHVSFGCIDGEFDSIYSAILIIHDIVNEIVWFDELSNDVKIKLKIIVSNYLKDNLG